MMTTTSTWQSPSIRVARGALALLSAQPLTWAATLLSAVLGPRYLGVQGMGECTVALTAAALLGSAVCLGVPNALPRRVARQPESLAADVSAALAMLIVTGTLGSVALLAVVHIFQLGWVREDLLAIALVGMVNSLAQGTLFSTLNGQGRHARFAWVNALVMVVPIFVSLAVLAGGGDVVAFLATATLVGVVGTPVIWRLSGPPLRQDAFRWGLWRELAREGWPLLGMSLIQRIRLEGDRLLLVGLASAQAVGWYAAAGRIASVPVFIPVLVITPLLPALSRHSNDRLVVRQTLERSITLTLLLTAPIAAALFAYAPVVPAILGWGPSFDQAIPLLMLMALQQPLVALDMVLGTALIALNRERPWLGVFVLGTGLACGANVLVIPLADQMVGNGAIAAAAVSVAVEVLLIIGTIALFPRGVLTRAAGWSVLKIMLAATCFAALSSVVLPLSLPLSLAAGGAAFAGTAWVSGAIRTSELKLLLRMTTDLASRRGPQ